MPAAGGTTVSSEHDNDSVTVLCAWCGTVLHRGGEAISHGICKDCAPALLDKIRERLKEPRGSNRASRDAERKSDSAAKRERKPEPQ
jgi:hypothetical protein